MLGWCGGCGVSFLNLNFNIHFLGCPLGGCSWCVGMRICGAFGKFCRNL